LCCDKIKIKAVTGKLTIGALARHCGLSADTLRYYEKMNLLLPEGRTKAGYRLYGADTPQRLRFIRGAKELGFSLEDIRRLLMLRGSDSASCAQILEHTEAKIRQCQQKIEELQAIKKALLRLAGDCPGDDSALDCCPIVAHLDGEPMHPAPARTKLPARIKAHKRSAHKTAHKTNEQRRGKSPHRGKSLKTGVATLLLGLLALSPFLWALPARAKPISYVDGVMVMQENDETGHTLSLDYTFSPRHAAALYVKKEKRGEAFFTAGPQLNSLIKRWNFPGAQGNIFNMSGAGVTRLNGQNKASAWTGILADCETRRIFTSYEVRFFYVAELEKSVWQRGRVGFSPYLTGYDGLSTWFMVQLDHHPAKNNALVVTPLVRFFYKTLLWEAGYSSNRHVMFNWVLQL
jgi:MerR family Zn(II)-responsive transcriptional regulator of zntA